MCILAACRVSAPFGSGFAVGPFAAVPVVGYVQSPYDFDINSTTLRYDGVYKQLSLISESSWAILDIPSEKGYGVGCVSGPVYTLTGDEHAILVSPDGKKYPLAAHTSYNTEQGSLSISPVNSQDIPQGYSIIDPIDS